MGLRKIKDSAFIFTVDENQKLCELINNSEDWLLERLMFYVKDRGFGEYVPPLIESWRLALSGVSRSLVTGLNTLYPDFELNPDEDYSTDPISDFAKTESIRHRERGLTVEMFLCLLIYFKQIYQELILTSGFNDDFQKHSSRVIGRFFDRMILSVSREWTGYDQSRLITDLQDNNRAMTNEKNKYLAIFESHPHMVFILDDEFKIDNMNHAATVLFEDARLPGSHYYQLEKKNGSIMPVLRVSNTEGSDNVHKMPSEDMFPWLTDDLHDFIERGDRVRSFERKVETGEGARYYMVNLSQPIDASGKLRGLILSLEDITGKKKAEEELRLAKDHAEAANRAKSIFLANMSHELRTPLNAILGFTEIMRESENMPAEEKENCKIVHRSGEHLLGLINNVLDIAKIESGKTEISRTSFDIGDTVSEIVRMMGSRAREKNLEITTLIAEDLPSFILTDKQKLRQILINLFGNAIKYTERGAISLTVSKYTDEDNPVITFEIEDSGIGIHEDDLENVFTPFGQSRTNITRTGTGLGLTISKQYAELLGGTISLESRVNSGSRFTLKIPLVTSEQEDHHSASGKFINVKSVAPGQPDYKILIVEDRIENWLLLQRIHESIGIPAMVAENGLAGVETFRELRPHLIWMDVRMPIMDGLEATKAIRKMETGNDVKIIGISAHVFKDEIHSMMSAGMDGFIKKPYQSCDIYQCLNEQLGLQFLFDPPIATPELKVLTADMLKNTDRTILKKLERAIKNLNDREINEVINQIQASDTELGKTLAYYTANLKYSEIYRLLNGNV